MLPITHYPHRHLGVEAIHLDIFFKRWGHDLEHRLMRLLEQPRRRRHPTSQTRSHLRGNTGVAEVLKAATSKLQSEGPPSMRIGFFSESAMAFNAMPNPQALARAPIPISLNSTTLRIAVKEVAATVPDDSPLRIARRDRRGVGRRCNICVARASRH